MAKIVRIEGFTNESFVKETLDYLDEFELSLSINALGQGDVTENITSSNLNKTSTATMPKIKFRELDTENVVLWFAQLETQFQAYGIVDERRRFVLLSGLLKNEQSLIISNITLNPEKYEHLYSEAKNILIKAYEISLMKRIEKAFQMEPDVSEKPSQYLGRFNILLGDISLDDIKSWIVMKRLPALLQTTLLNDASIKNSHNLVEKADKLLPNGMPTDFHNNVNIISNDNRKKLCYFHRKFGKKATKCGGTPKIKCPMWQRALQQDINNVEDSEN